MMIFKKTAIYRYPRTIFAVSPLFFASLPLYFAEDAMSELDPIGYR